jgi:hypothetical protein
MLTLSIHVTKLCSVDTEISVSAQAALVGSVIQDFRLALLNSWNTIFSPCCKIYGLELRHVWLH